MSHKTLFIVFLIPCCIFITTCKKPIKEMAVSTGTVTDITYNSAKVSGQIVDLGEGAIQYGHCYGKTSDVNITDSTTNNGIPTSTVNFTSELKNLETGITYYVKAYLSDGIKPVYGLEINFTLCTPPSTTTNAATNLGTTTATLNGTVNANSSSATVTFEYGTSTSYGSTITAAQSPVTGSSNTSVSAGIIGLTTNTVYHYRIKAVSCGGTITGSDQQFSTTCQTPTANTITATNVGSTTATLNGTVNANGSLTTITFEYGTTTSYGSTITASQSPVTGSSNTSVSAGITGLIPGSVYHYRVKAVSCGGIITGTDLTFSTICTAPSATTNAPTSLANTTATLNGTVNANGCSTVVTFEYGLTTSYGSNITASQSPISGSSSTGVSAAITKLSSGQNYHFRVKVSSTGGTNYGNDMTFTTTVKDDDGNSYTTVTIGTQVWMKENLKTTKYNDGTSIPLVTDATAWTNLSTPGYCWYNNDAANYKAPYGALYNWYTVNTGNLCPTGWHVPTDAEWTTLTDYLGGTSVAGGKLKEEGTVNWNSPNTGATNESGFTALPGSGRSYVDGIFDYIGDYGYWWSSTVSSTSYAWVRELSYDLTDIISGGRGHINYGFSVRCIKN
jgi:uncharacterized protein (TIGR02145 family)